jgi:hypothetical protein
MDLKSCVLSVSSEILVELQKSQIISLEELDEVVQNRIGSIARLNFVPALSFLFLTGSLDYDESADAVVYSVDTGD